MRRHFTREYVTEALFRLMEKKPFSKITISEVVELAGTSRASFYRNYLSLDDVIKVWVEDFVESARPVNHIYMSDVYESIENLLCAMEQAKWELTLIHQAGLLSYFQQTMRDMTRQEVDAVNVTKNSYQAYFYGGATAGFLTAWIQNGFRESSEEMARLYLDCLRGYTDYALPLMEKRQQEQKEGPEAFARLNSPVSNIPSKRV